MCTLIEILPRTHVKGESLSRFKSGTFIDHFLSDGTACMAVKGLRRGEEPKDKHTYLDKYNGIF